MKKPLIKKQYPKLKQGLTYNQKTKMNEFITTGATMNNELFLSTPYILSNYEVSDTTLRKKFKERGVEFQDYFTSDNKIFIKEKFLVDSKIQLIPHNKTFINSNTRQKQIGRRFPYMLPVSTMPEKEKNILIQKSLSLEHTNPKLYLKSRIIQEIKRMHWDFFITINIPKFTTQDGWDNVMLKLMDNIGTVNSNKNMKCAYSTELSINIKDKRVTKYDHGHRHIHLLFDLAGTGSDPKIIENHFLEILGYNSFNRYAYHCDPYQPKMFAGNYILKTYNAKNDCFSFVVPNPEIFKKV